MENRRGTEREAAETKGEKRLTRFKVFGDLMKHCRECISSQLKQKLGKNEK